MKQKSLLLGAGMDLLIWIIACIICIPVMAILLKIVNVLIYVTVPIAVVVRVIACVITVCGIMGAVSFMVSYHNASFAWGECLLSLLLATVGRFILSYFLKFYPFVAGGSQYLASLIFYGGDAVNTNVVTNLRLYEYVTAFFILTVLEIAAFLIFGKLGASRRKRDRADLLAQGSEEKRTRS